MKIRIIAVITAVVMISAVMQFPAAASSKISAETIVRNMTLDEKISQMIIPAIRTWTGSDGKKANLTVLSEAPELAAALRKHQYGGVILFGQNITGTEQVVRLLSDLQKNNAERDNKSTVMIPYLTPVDEEGGIVLRLTSGTRMTGNMAIGATADKAEENAYKTGSVIGSELAAVGFNVNFAPDADVNNNPENPVIGTRAFSDDPDTVAKLAVSYTKGLSEHNVIGTYKHFPGHGDTVTDSHIGTPSVNKTYEELKKTELVPFKKAVESGADMIMTAHITYPAVCDPVKFADGTEGCYPATMSYRMIQEILRGDLGFDGVVVTDALEMGAIESGGLVAGAAGSVENRVNIAKEVINAGVDILLIPTDLDSAAKAEFYDAYIAELCKKVENGEISADRINESVTRILNLKIKYGVFDTDVTGATVEKTVGNAKNVVGSAENHKTESEIARQAITLVKNEGNALPLRGYGRNIVLLGRNNTDGVALMSAVIHLMECGAIDGGAYVENLITGETKGSADSAKTVITIDYYYETSPETALRYTDKVKEAVKNADAVAALSKNFGLSGLHETNIQYSGIKTIMDDTHAAGGKFILISDNLPYDSARFTGADAILLAYMGSGLDTDPTSKGDNSAVGAYNANVRAAVETVFDENQPTGKTPVIIPKIEVKDGKASYTKETMYDRSFGLEYTYSIGAENEEGEFYSTARADKLVRLLIDGSEVSADGYGVSGDGGRINLLQTDTLTNGAHKLTAVYDYGKGEFGLETEFVLKGGAQTTDEESQTENADSQTTDEVSQTTDTESQTTDEVSHTADKNSKIVPVIVIIAALLIIAAVIIILVKRKSANK